MTAAAVSARVDVRLPTRWVHALAAACCVFTGLSFWYIDRSYGDFHRAVLLWPPAVAIGFAAGAFNLRREAGAGRALAMLLGALFAFFAVYPGFVLYSLLRWGALCLLFVTVARAPLMRTRRDLYFALLACFVCGTVAVVHGRADWTLWVYLGPAWLAAGLALTLDHVATRAVSGWAKAAASAGFVGACALVAMLLFVALPRPAQLGWGFLPPGADAPALARSPGGGQGSARGGDGAASGADGAAQQPAPRSDALRTIDALRATLADPHMPRWQRALLGRLLDATEAGAQVVEGAAQGALVVEHWVRVELPRLPRWFWPAVLLLALASHAVWQRRHAIALNALSLPAWLLQRVQPQRSMRISAWMIDHALAHAGARRTQQRTLREQLAHAPAVPPFARHRFGDALDLYYAARYGRGAAMPAQAAAMRSAVLDAADVLLASRRADAARGSAA